MRQLALDFPTLVRDLEATNVEARCQKAAREALGAWRAWPGGLLLLVGPEGAGKSHLAALWARETGASMLAPDDGEPPQGPLAIDDVDRIVPERRLLALIDAVREGRCGPLLATARSVPGEGEAANGAASEAASGALWTPGLPDLASRLALMPTVRIEDPSDEDLAAVFAKHLGDRGAEAPQTLVDYVVRRIERSFAAARKAAQILDRAALERKQRISRKLAADVLGGGGLEAPDEAAQED